MRAEKDFEDLLRSFNKYNVKYCIVGAFAVGFYSKPRYTKDMDIFVEPNLDNAQNIIKALDEFGFGKLNLNVQDFTTKNKIIQLGYEPIRIDIITAISGCKFSQVWKNKKTSMYGKQKVFFIGLDTLIKNKKASKRKQDKVDLELLLKAKPAPRAR